MIKKSDKIYCEIIENLRSSIVTKSGSVSKFCAENNMSRFNLSAVFNGHQSLSLSLYIRINESLGVLRPGHNKEFSSTLTLQEYLGLDHGSILQSMFNNIIEG